MPSLPDFLKKKENFYTDKTWSEHYLEWSVCKACPLCQTRKQVVLARGTVPCDVLFIGEAPGHSENSLGKPFMGPAGALLDEMIVEAGINELISVDVEGNETPLTISFTNLIACIPFEEGKVRQPSELEIRACARRLEEFIQICKPKVIVRVGKVAQQWLSDDNSLLIKTLSIDHPAMILREPVYNRAMTRQRNVNILKEGLEEI